MNKKVYLAGPVSGDPDYKKNFAEAERKLREAGYKVLTTTAIPDDLDYEDYFTIGFAMIDVCDEICLLPGFSDSPGTMREILYASSKKKKSELLEELIKCEP